MNHHVPGELMIAEILEEPAALDRLIEKELKRVWELAERWADHPPRFIIGQVAHSGGIGFPKCFGATPCVIAGNLALMVG